MSMSDFPDEILWEILSRLPVVALLRFRCVSKSLKSLIENQKFIKHHLNHSLKTNSNINIILKSLDIILSSRHFYSVDFDLLNKTNWANFQELIHRLEAPFDASRTEILGSCDGLLALSMAEDSDVILCLWNPSVRRFHEIPYSAIELSGYNRDVFNRYGFGYDAVSDDYKLIRIVQLYKKDDDECNYEVKVYSLKSDSWRRIPDLPDYILCSTDIRVDGVLANGALHWIVTGNEKLVAAFDLGTEKYRSMPLPNFAGDTDTAVELVVLGGCLSLMWHVNADSVHIWVMKEYGVQESWSFLFSFDYIGYAYDTKPIAYSKCGRKVLLDHYLMWYDLDKKSTDVQMPLGDTYDMCTCVQSLNGTSCDFDVVTKKKQECKDKKRKVLEQGNHLPLIIYRRRHPQWAK